MAISQSLKTRIASAMRTREDSVEMATLLDTIVPAASIATSAYTPAVSGDYSPAVDTIAEALDQLAARVQALEDAP